MAILEGWEKTKDIQDCILTGEHCNCYDSVGGVCCDCKRVKQTIMIG